MRSNSRVLLSALVVTVSTAALLFAQLPREGFVFNGRRFASQLDFIQQGCRCSTRTPSADVIAAIEKALQARGGRVAASSAVEIPVQFIHITDGANGQITETQRLDQVQVLNDSYSAWGITFLYDPMVNPPIFEDNASWYRMTPGSAAERQAKAALQVDPTKNLNFYTAGIGQGLLGWATFPNQLQSDPTNDGVVCLDESLPGGSAAPYNLGDTATHEVGHWLGLFHTFQNGCFGQGDQVNDTPAHSSPNYGCPDPTQPNGACVQGELAPVENFMNYTDDICMIEFTLGQSDRMHSMIETYRPGLLGEDPCDCPITCIQRAIPPALRFDDEVLDLLRDFRDLVLHRSEDGRQLASLYYEHSSELFEIMLWNPNLAVRTMSALQAQTSNLSQQTGTLTTTVSMSHEQFDTVMALSAEFSENASAELQEAISNVQDILWKRARLEETQVQLDFTPETQLEPVLGATR